MKTKSTLFIDESIEYSIVDLFFLFASDSKLIEADKYDRWTINFNETTRKKVYIDLQPPPVQFRPTSAAHPIASINNTNPR
ncbi:hypothetical protein QVD17_39401 [Tagetes erecta]|uniref:Uncharacterized protein n=1 Tax=Tagetes erecta TaxID=13708 RepID=A0AAD8JQP3_TARER|nr:hypothetical protein QVD17_39401 [Tagetes erecta]